MVLGTGKALQQHTCVATSPRSLFNHFFFIRKVLFVVTVEGITPCWKSVHRISGTDIRGIENGYHEKIDKISIKYLTDFIRILKNICWTYQNISRISVDGQWSQKAKNFKKIAGNSD